MIQFLKIKPLWIPAVIGLITQIGSCKVPSITNSRPEKKTSAPDPNQTSDATSAYCSNVGSLPVHYKSSEGNNLSFCKFDAALIEEQTHSRAKNRAGASQPLAVEAYFAPHSSLSPTATSSTAPGGANPASVYCESIKGQSLNYKSADGETGVCVFNDDSKIEEWSLFYGAQDERNKKLTDSLR